MKRSNRYHPLLPSFSLTNIRETVFFLGGGLRTPPFPRTPHQFQNHDGTLSDVSQNLRRVELSRQTTCPSSSLKQSRYFGTPQQFHFVKEFLDDDLSDDSSESQAPRFHTQPPVYLPPPFYSFLNFSV